VLALLVAFTFHEASHALVAYRLGDDTAKRLGRLTLNPLAHLDPLGTLMIFVASFGWGKPVPVNPYRLRHPGGRLGMGLVSAAGPVANLLLGWAFAAPFRAGLIHTIAPISLFIPSLGQVLYTIVILNVFLAVFNLLPIPPLDGFKVAIALLPQQTAYSLSRFEQYGPLLLLGLVLFVPYLFRVDLLGALMHPLANVFLGLFLR